MRILVGIPNYGTKNRRFLDRVLDSLRDIPHDLHVVVNSEVARDYPADVENIVGLPTENPRSLPFAHRALFAERVDDYDLFIYVEDDTLVEARHVDAFVEAAAVLPAGDVAGFLRFERFGADERSICSVHSSYRWDPASVAVHDGLRFAHFTNLHAACYMLTRAQLRQCIDSGEYLVEPHAGRYQMLESAATDPYVACGLRKVVSLDRFEDSLLHHMPELYLGRLGDREARVALAVDTLQPGLDARSALEPDTSLPTFVWDLDLYLRLPGPVLELVDGSHRRVLTVGGAGGRAEQQLRDRGAAVTTVPVDAVFGAQMAVEGVHVLAPDVEEALSTLAGREFDLVVFADTLAFLPQPDAVLRSVSALLSADGRVVVLHRSGAFETLRESVAQRRLQPIGRWNHPTHGRWTPSARWLRRQLGSAGLEYTIDGCGEGDRASPVNRLVPGPLKPLLLPFCVGIGRVAS